RPVGQRLGRHTCAPCYSPVSCPSAPAERRPGRGNGSTPVVVEAKRLGKRPRSVERSTWPAGTSGVPNDGRVRTPYSLGGAEAFRRTWNRHRSARNRTKRRLTRTRAW